MPETSRANSREQRTACDTALAHLRGGDRRSMAAWLRDHLFGHVLPFWERHGFDPRGGLFNAVTDEGVVLNPDKWLWSQWRAVWVFSALHRRFGGDARWLSRAQEIAAFCLRHGWDEKANGWALLLSQEGKILRGYESIYVDAFAVYGLTELFSASRDPKFLRIACRTADAALTRMTQPYDQLPHFPYPIPSGAQPHGIPMIWSLILAELAVASGENRYREAALRLSEEVWRDHFRRDRNLILEFVSLDGRELPAPLGTAVVPGHVVEDMWFQAHVSRLLGVSTEPSYHELTLRHLRLGWDRAHGGGLLLAVDADARPEAGWKFSDTKLWWPHTEALYAALLGWDQTGRGEFLDWYERTWRVCLEHFVDWEHGEWRQKLDRGFAPITDVVALPVKDPFHLPRSLMLQIELLEKGFLPGGET